jgi:hypothetical protein
MSWLVRVGLLAAVGCGNASEPGAGSGSGSAPGSIAGSATGSAADASAAPPVDAAAGPPAPSFDAVMAWMPPDARAAWQGAWLTRMEMRDSASLTSYTGAWAALEVDGDSARVWTAASQKAHALGFAIATPCHVRLTETDADGGRSFFRKTFLIDRGTLLAERGGGVGYRKGKAAIVCKNDDVYVLDEAGTCTQWEERFGTYEAKAATCTWSTGKPDWAMGEGWSDETLTIGESALDTTLAVRGEVLVNIHWREALEGKGFTRQRDFEAARTAATQRFQETDPLERVKTAGGKVGAMGTILDLHATFLADDAAVKGKPIDVKGVIVSVDEDDDEAKPVWRVKLVDPRDKPKDWELMCTSDRAVKLAVGTRVKVKGTGSAWWDRAAVVACSVTR